MKLKFKWKMIFGFIIFIFLLLIYMRFVGTASLFVKEYKIVNKNLSSFYGFKIVHFSDLHYGMSVNEKKLNKLINMINDTKPDMIVFTGDLIDKKITDDTSKLLIDKLSKLNAAYGKYYVTGNHDINNLSYNSIMQNSGFKNLDEGYEIITSKDNKNMFIGGVSVDKDISNNIIDNLNSKKYDYKIYLVHYPDEIDKVLDYNFDLILCGHSHNGQVRFPVIGKIYTPINSKKYYDSYYKVNNTNIYISGGIGNSKVNLRFFNRPSFNLYRLVDK